MMINIELTERGPLTFCRLARPGSRGLECYADLRSPVLRRLTISNRDSKLLERPQLKQNNHHHPLLIETKLKGHPTPIRPRNQQKPNADSEPDPPIRRIPREPKWG